MPNLNLNQVAALASVMDDLISAYDKGLVSVEINRCDYDELLTS